MAESWTWRILTASELLKSQLKNFCESTALSPFKLPLFGEMRSACPILPYLCLCPISFNAFLFHRWSQAFEKNVVFFRCRQLSRSSEFWSTWYGPWTASSQRASEVSKAAVIERNIWSLIAKPVRADENTSLNLCWFCRFRYRSMWLCQCSKILALWLRMRCNVQLQSRCSRFLFRSTIHCLEKSGSGEMCLHPLRDVFRLRPNSSKVCDALAVGKIGWAFPLKRKLEMKYILGPAFQWIQWIFLLTEMTMWM